MLRIFSVLPHSGDEVADYSRVQKKYNACGARILRADHMHLTISKMWLMILYSRPHVHCIEAEHTESNKPYT
jgi:hypothetical protein